MKKRFFTVIIVAIIFGICNCVVHAAENDSQIRVEVERFFTGEYEQYGIIKAYQNKELLWEHTTKEVICAQLQNISDVYVNGDTVYIVVEGEVHAFDLQTGNEKWTTTCKSDSLIGSAGASNQLCFDKYGNIYISGFYGPNVIALDKNGKVIYWECSDDYGWVYDLNVDGDTLYVYYDFDIYESNINPGYKTFDISQFSNIGVEINGTPIMFDRKPFIENGRTLVPVRAIFEALGAEVNWTEETQTVVAERGGKEVSIAIDSNTMIVDGEEKILDVPAKLKGGRTFVPARAVAEAFDCVVEWDESVMTVVITTGDNREIISSMPEDNDKIILEYMQKYFENTQLRVQGEAFVTIATDTNYVDTTHWMRGFYFEDVDADGKSEMIVTSKAMTNGYQEYGSCFSVWDCNDAGEVYCVFAKCGQESRMAYRYFLIEYEDEIMILESTGETSSAGRSSIRNLYVIRDGQIVNNGNIYCSTFPSGKDSCVVNNKTVSVEDAKKYLENFDNSMKILFKQFI